MILHNFCFLFFNWQQVVNVSHDSQYVAKRTLKCHCIRLHRIIKQIYILTKIIYMDTNDGQLELCPRFVKIWGLSCQRPNNKNLLPIHAIRMLIIDRYSYLYSSTSTRTRTRTHVIIKYLDSYSHILQVLVLVLVHLVLAPALGEKHDQWTGSLFIYSSRSRYLNQCWLMNNVLLGRLAYNQGAFCVCAQPMRDDVTS